MSDDGIIPKGSILGVRSRLTFSGEPEPMLALGVLCPRKATDVPLVECSRCEDCSGLRVAADGLEGFVSCDASSIHAEASVQPDESASPPGPRDVAADRAPIASIMTTRVICVGPKLRLDALEALLLDRGISGAPVVDESGRPIGMVSKTDLFRHHEEPRVGDGADRVVVRDIMMPVAFCLPASETIAKAAALMAFERMHRVPIVNTRRQVVGLVSPLDVLTWIARRHGYVIGRGPREDARPQFRR